MRALLLAGAYLFAACGRQECNLPPRTNNPQLVKYAQAMFAEANASGLNNGYPLWSLRFGNTSRPEHIGECSIYRYTEVDVLLGRRDKYLRVVTIVEGLDPLLTETVVRHELGHCSYGLPHTTTPNTLMYPAAPHVETYGELRRLTADMFASVSSRFAK